MGQGKRVGLDDRRERAGYVEVTTHHLRDTLARTKDSANDSKDMADERNSRADEGGGVTRHQ